MEEHCNHECVCEEFKWELKNAYITPFAVNVRCMRNYTGCMPCAHDTRLQEPNLQPSEETISEVLRLLEQLREKFETGEMVFSGQSKPVSQRLLYSKLGVEAEMTVVKSLQKKAE